MITLKHTSRSEIAKVVEFVGRIPGTTVIVHSSLIPFGVIEGGVEYFWDVLWKAVGDNRTLVMPTFTFSFGVTRLWKYAGSRSETGALTEYFRRHFAKVRTIHPVHSVSVSGPDAQIYSGLSSKTSFGVGSAWERLCVDGGAWNVSIGIGFIGGATFCHYAEEKMKVPYREYLELPGTVLDKELKKIDAEFGIYARRSVNGRAAINYWRRAIHDLEQAGLLKNYIVSGCIPVTAMQIKPVTDYLLYRIGKDPFYLGGFTEEK